MTVVLHQGTAFVLADEAGDFSSDSERGFYFEDVRCLSTLRLTIDAERLVPLTCEQRGASQCEHVAGNALTANVPASVLVIRRRRTLGQSLHEELDIDYHGDEPARFTVALEVDSDFADIYAVKTKALAEQQSRADAGLATRSVDETGAHAGRRLTLRRVIAGSACSAAICFSRAPRFTNGAAHFDVELSRGRTWSLLIDVVAAIDHPGQERSTQSLVPRSHQSRRAQLSQALPTLECDLPVLAEAYRTASRDLVDLRLSAEDNLDGDYAVAAGVPWYMALFGRDSLIASYQSLLHDPDLGRGTLTALARLQGSVVDPASEEEPGRILHEYRKHLRASERRNIPKFPYYGSVDATPLFLITLSEYVRCTGDVTLLRALAANVDRAVAWIENRGDSDGFVEYSTRPGGFLVNEGWKDSVDSVRFADGRIARQPIALVEVQGYVADAFARLDELYVALDRPDEALRLRARSTELRRRIEQKLWLPARDTYAEALDGDKRAVDALTSNPGHLLWSRAIEPERARRVADTLLGESMFSGWGVRTMGAGEGGYNPISYHNGSLWPHDNSLLLQGLVRYRLHDHAARLSAALLDALAAEPDHRFPELFAGLARHERPRPVAYPNANKPQAWSSGAVILLVRSLIGLEVDALGARLTLSPTRLPGLGRLTLRQLPLGGTRVTLDVRFAGGDPDVRIDGLPAHWSLNVEPAANSG